MNHLRSNRYRSIGRTQIVAASLVCCVACFERADAPMPSSAATPSASNSPAPAFAHASQVALEQLRAESAFVSARVGYGGFPSGQARALRVLIADPRRAELLQSLWTNATPAGRLYALVGFALTDSVTFEQNIELVARDSRVIPAIEGCIMFSERVSTLARHLSPEFVKEFRSDSATSRREALMDSLAASRERSQRLPP